MRTAFFFLPTFNHQIDWSPPTINLRRFRVISFHLVSTYKNVKICLIAKNFSSLNLKIHLWTLDEIMDGNETFYNCEVRNLFQKKLCDIRYDNLLSCLRDFKQSQTYKVFFLLTNSWIFMQFSCWTANAFVCL